MKNILVENGWVLHHSCNCGGFFNEIFQKNKGRDLEVWIRPNQSTFQIKRDGFVIIKGSALKLKESIEGL